MPGPENDLLFQRLQTVRDTAAAAAAEGGYAMPQIIAVTKTHPASMILPLKSMGITEIGENRVQEVTEKLPDLKENFHIHLIGRLQSNKVKYIINDVCLIQSLDRMSLAQEIDRQAAKAGRVMPVLVQVSPAGEEQKGGIAPEETLSFIREAARLPHLHICGLMAVMPNTRDEQLLLRLFGETRTLFERMRDTAVQGVDMQQLSMGMSGDYALAARCGATMVRVGSALFGPRDYAKPADLPT